MRIFSWLTACAVLVACEADRTAGRGALVPADVPDSVVDSRGRRLSTSAPRARVISLVPSLTETIVEIGAVPLLVGRTRFDRDPRLDGVPSVGGTVDADVEAILEARPDLVITWADVDVRSLTERLESFGVSVYAARSHSMADFALHTRALGRLLGRAAEADSLIGRVEAGLDAARDSADALARPSVLFVLWPLPLTTVGRGTFVAELIHLVGARGLFDDLDQPWPMVSFEAVLERDPDLIVIATDDVRGQAPAWIRRHPRWSALDAVREGRIHLVDADLFNRPGPRMHVAAAELAMYVRALESGR